MSVFFVVQSRLQLSKKRESFIPQGFFAPDKADFL